MNIAEYVCPVCQERNEPEAVLCRHCGAALEDSLMGPGISTQTTNMPASIPGSGDWEIGETVVPDHGLVVYMEGEAKPVYMDSSEEFIMGRRAGGTSQPLIADGLLDLAPNGGYSRGVSRRHVAIKRTEQGYQILDLGSVNGTWLNNERLTPHKLYPLASGSHLRLGSMRFYVLYRSPAESKQAL